MPSNAWKNVMASSNTSAPTTFDTWRTNAWAATFTAFITPRVGAISTR
jgi:hypothetical protein